MPTPATHPADNLSLEEARRALHVEAAVDRVRARALAMRRSEEVYEVAVTLREEMIGLEIPGIIAASIYKWQSEGVIRMWDLTKLDPGAEKGFEIDEVIPLDPVPPEIHIPRLMAFEGTYEVFASDKRTMLVTAEWWGTHHNPEQGEELRQAIESDTLPGAWFPAVPIDNGRMSLDMAQPPPPEMEWILPKFASAFDLAFRRFEDLQTAEEAAREARLEAAVERVRGRALAMHHSDDLFGVADLLRSELGALDIPGLMGSAIYLVDENDIIRSWDRSAIGEGDVAAVQLEFDPKAYPLLGSLWTRWKDSESYFEAFYDLENVGGFLEELSTLAPEAHDAFVRAIDAGEWTRQWLAAGSFTHGWIGSDLYEEPDAWTQTVHRRMAAAFDLAHQRFQDLLSAEEAAREARIEAALERIRTQTMAMRESSEIGSILGSIFAELQTLDMALARCIMWIFHEEDRQIEWFLANPEAEGGATSYRVDYKDHPTFNAYRQAWQDRESLWLYTLGGETKESWDDYLFSNGLGALPPPVQEGMRAPETVYLSNTFGDYGSLMAGSLEPLEEASLDIIERFGRVFQQSYARFQDVRQAEAATREAEIEASLERVRSRAMAMRHSDDLGEVVDVIFKELELSFREQICIFIHHDPVSGDLEWWSTGMGAGVLPKGYTIPNLREIRDHPMVQRYLTDLEDGTPYSVFELSGETKRSWDRMLFELTELRELPEETKQAMMSFPKVFLSDAYLKNAMLEIAGPEPLSEDQAQTLRRFAKVVEFSYTRVADLHKAEEKAREARIEAALERVRTRTMAMQHSTEIGSILGSMFSELKELDVALARCVIWIFHDDERKVEWFFAVPEVDAAAMSFKVDYTDHPVHNAYYQAWRERRSMWLYTLGGALKRSWEDYIFGNGLSELPLPAQEGMRAPDTVHLSNTFGDFGLLMAGSPEPLPKESLDIMQRFGRVFQQSYARFLDVRQAEAQAREAEVEAAMERVRSRAMAMQEPEELEEVVNVMRDEFGRLGLDELETSSIFLREADDELRCWFCIAGPEDRVSGDILLDLDTTTVSRELGAFLDSGAPQVSIPMTGLARREWIEYCYSLAPAFEGFYGQDIPDRTYHLARFSHGAIAAATPGELSEESWSVLRRGATAFELAYSRFSDLLRAREDLRKLKDEKARTEAALAELRTTQTQLIEQEKLASLGSLTAGIAHEIKNPLNFVNNFAEVNAELAEEVREALAAGDSQAALEALGDLESNSEQIAKHGRRADSIVKAMMQHARGGDSQRETIDINAFVEEYAALAWHGMRARDHGFQAELIRDLDPATGTVQGLPQELGRVMVNLLGNAFDAVRGVDYGTVRLSTSREGERVVIRVSDNGPGIPEDIRHKIFEPFFTTKPTGEGTGLGLSLSYDIVTKGHGGSMEATESPEGGAEFTVRLPA